jgi:hypothetical protein
LDAFSQLFFGDPHFPCTCKVAFRSGFTAHGQDKGEVDELFCFGVQGPILVGAFKKILVTLFGVVNQIHFFPPESESEPFPAACCGAGDKNDTICSYSGFV